MSIQPFTEQVFEGDGVTLRSSRGKWFGILLVSLGFVAASVFVMFVGKVVVGYVAIGFFGLCAIVGAIGLIKPISVLRITQKDLKLVGWRRVTTYGWDEIDHFGVARMQHGKLVGITLVPAHPGATSKWAKLNLGICGYHAALPDTYGMSAEGLTDLLNQVHGQLSGSPS